MSRKSASKGTAPAALYVWLGSGSKRIEDGSIIQRIDRGGAPFVASTRWLAANARFLGKQILRVDEYEAVHGPIQTLEG
jgi:hypothetical protein